MREKATNKYKEYASVLAEAYPDIKAPDWSNLIGNPLKGDDPEAVELLDKSYREGLPKKLKEQGINIETYGNSFDDYMDGLVDHNLNMIKAKNTSDVSAFAQNAVKAAASNISRSYAGVARLAGFEEEAIDADSLDEYIRPNLALEYEFDETELKIVSRINFIFKGLRP